MADGYVYKDITAQAQFTDALMLRPSGGLLTIEDTSSISTTITLQVKEPTSDDWTDAATFTGAGCWDISACNEYWRAGVKTGDFTSGTATVHLRRRA